MHINICGCGASFNDYCALHSIAIEFQLCFRFCLYASAALYAPASLYSSKASLSWLFTFFIAYIAASMDLDFILAWLRCCVAFVMLIKFCGMHFV